MQSRSNKQFCTQGDTRGGTLRPDTGCGETRKRASESEMSWLQGIHLAHPLVRKQIGTRLRSGGSWHRVTIPTHPLGRKQIVRGVPNQARHGSRKPPLTYPITKNQIGTSPSRSDPTEIPQAMLRFPGPEIIRRPPLPEHRIFGVPQAMNTRPGLVTELLSLDGYAPGGMRHAPPVCRMMRPRPLEVTVLGYAQGMRRPSQHEALASNSIGSTGPLEFVPPAPRNQRI